jgi:hypothetical protein
MRDYEYDLELLIAGFDENNNARIFSLSSIDRGIPQRHDLGFEAIGSGSTNARFIMTYRRFSSSLKVREAVVPAPTLATVMIELSAAYRAQRLSDAEALFLAPIGWTIERSHLLHCLRDIVTDRSYPFPVCRKQHEPTT